ncbi:cellulose synthase-like protein H1 [Amborella trichopoda]|uniref:cellulose synthase-like protein H1 n=1 Tax=Amborella trichopoda TaxID=13333 RepID=UPI0009BEC188|nr:cellulose synthase-like protein H1 [Amborella trichopoda]|eukprot:XP_020524403.1 cellulose synthase-like protein H1 [Amborella trichopoda]
MAPNFSYQSSGNIHRAEEEDGAVQERIKVNTTYLNAFSLFLFVLLLSFIFYRFSTLSVHKGLNHVIWTLALACETCFACLWILSMNIRWRMVEYRTYPNRLLKRLKSESELPAVDMFVTTADALKEPPILTVNTVLSLLAVDYPLNKLACYVSDEGASPLTFYALTEAAEYVRLWVPFCKKHGVGVRAPFIYFSETSHNCDSFTSEFLTEWKKMKSEYDELSRRINEAVTSKSVPYPNMNEEFAAFSRIEGGDHPSIIKVIVENRERSSGGLAHVIYVSREKRPKHPHHYKAGAMNVLTRVSAVMTNAPIIMNVDCDMFVNNPTCFYEAMCLLLGFKSERESAFVQFPQVFYGGLKDDPFGNQLKVLFSVVMAGVSGIKGPPYSGTGCFHRRKAIYGFPPDDSKGKCLEFFDGIQPHVYLDCNLKYGLPFSGSNEANMEELINRFGYCEELLRSILGIHLDKAGDTLSFERKVEVAHIVAGCKYENNTYWGHQVGWVYVSCTEDLILSLKLFAAGWRSVYCTPKPPAFLGCAPCSGPETLLQQRRWAAGLLEVVVGRHSPLLSAITKMLKIRQCLAFLNLWALRPIPEICYSILPAISLLTNAHFLPKFHEPIVLIPISLFLLFNFFGLMEYWRCNLSTREWWNNQRMSRINCASGWLFGFFDVTLKLLGLSDIVFVVTPKDEGDNDLYANKFTFNSHVMFIPPTTLLFLNLASLVMVAPKLARGDFNMLLEVICSAWVVACFSPFLKGLVRKGRYGIPWSIICKSGTLALMFVYICKLHVQGG